MQAPEDPKGLLLTAISNLTPILAPTLLSTVSPITILQQISETNPPWLLCSDRGWPLVQVGFTLVCRLLTGVQVRVQIKKKILPSDSWKCDGCNVCLLKTRFCLNCEKKLAFFPYTPLVLALQETTALSQEIRDSLGLSNLAGHVQISGPETHEMGSELPGYTTAL